jgi:hypothetical protein
MLFIILEDNSFTAIEKKEVFNTILFTNGEMRFNRQKIVWFSEDLDEVFNWWKKLNDKVKQNNSTCYYFNKIFDQMKYN